ncbi:MAG: hypothetical protein RIS94_2077 [Pseudomonadota bacterium]|jgi:hypothetical protein
MLRAVVPNRIAAFPFASASRIVCAMLGTMIDRARVAVRSSPGWFAALVAALAWAAWLRVAQAAAPVVFDEYASIFFSRHGFGQLWGAWMLRETNPPLFYSLLKLWRMAVPDDVLALRLLPLGIDMAQIALLAGFAWRRYGPAAAVLAVMVVACSASDIYHAPYLRGYGLSKLAVTVSFIGLVRALDGDGEGGTGRRGWIAFAGGAVVAIYCHTTMLIWPLVAGAALAIDALLAPGESRARWRQLLLAGVAILIASAWVLTQGVMQLRGHNPNINWIEPLDLDDFVSSVNLQLLLDGTIGSVAMVALMAAGTVRTAGTRATRLALLSLVLGVAAFKACDAVHPIISDYTLHWASPFSAWLAGAAVARGGGEALRRGVPRALRIATVAGMALLGRWALATEAYISHPQDWQASIRRVAATPQAAMLVSHESIGVVVQQACMIEFHAATCPFPLVVMANPAPTDSWAFGGYRGPIVSPFGVRRALGKAETVFAFSRYVYRPLDPFGLDKGDYDETLWDDGELIGPIPVSHFDVRPFSRPPIPDPPPDPD